MHRLRPKATYVTILGAEGFARGLLFVALVSYWVVQARLNSLQLVVLCMTVLAGQVDPRLPIVAGGALLVVVSAMAAVLMTEEPISRSPGSKSRWREIVAAGATGARRIGANRTLFVLVLVALALG